MKNETGTMTTTAIFSDDKQRRYLLRKEWDSSKPKAVIIMIHPSMASIDHLDFTTLYILNNIIKLGFGGIDIVNLMSTCTTKLENSELNSALEDENIGTILESVKNADKVIIAWGKGGDSNRKLGLLQKSLLQHLKPHKAKLFDISDGSGRSGFHPLAPQIRFIWQLNPFVMPKLNTPQKNTEKTEIKKT